eukprot:SAG22_NODE_15437_length_349_cov_0.556000_1_plen_81_part_01
MANGMPAHCVGLSVGSDSEALLDLTSLAAALELASTASVHEDTELMLTPLAEDAERLELVKLARKALARRAALKLPPSATD